MKSKKLSLNHYYKIWAGNTAEESPQEIENKSALSFNSEKNIIYIHGAIEEEDGILFQQICETIMDTWEGENSIRLSINSEGGSLNAGLNIISQIEYLRKNGIFIDTIVEEKAFSMAFLIAICCDNRGIRKYAKMMLHPSWFNLNDAIPLTIEIIREFADSSDKAWETMSLIILDKTKISQEKLNCIYDTCDDYEIDAAEALRLGCVDYIL